MSKWPWNWRKKTARVEPTAPVESTFQWNGDDIVVFVVGPTGSGKSAFVHAVTQTLGLDIGKGLGVTTKKVHPIRCELTDEAQKVAGAKNIVFVDTPSFHTDPVENDKVESEMKSWLEKSKAESASYGTIYMQRIETDPTTDPVKKHLDTFARTFPKDLATQASPMRLHCVFSCIDSVNSEKITHHRGEFKSQLKNLKFSIVDATLKLKWNVSIHADFFVSGDPKTAWSAVQTLFSSPTLSPTPSPTPLPTP